MTKLSLLLSFSPTKPSALFLPVRAIFRLLVELAPSDVTLATLLETVEHQVPLLAPLDLSSLPQAPAPLQGSSSHHSPISLQTPVSLQRLPLLRRPLLSFAQLRASFSLLSPPSSAQHHASCVHPVDNMLHARLPHKHMLGKVLAKPTAGLFCRVSVLTSSSSE